MLGTNDITSDSSPGHPGRTTIGLEGYLSFDYHRFSFQNQWTYLDIGVRIMDGGSNTSQQDAISDNYFGFNDVGIELHGGMAAIPTPSIGCNTFEKNTLAINVNTALPVQISGSDNGTGTTWEPAANAYAGNALDVKNTQGPLTYYEYDPIRNQPPYATTGQAEAVRFSTAAGLSLLQRGGTPCYARDEQLGVYGLNRPSAGSVTSADCQQWENQIRTTTWNDPATLLLTLRLIDYQEQAGQLADLETFAKTLPLQNAPAFDRISLYLMESYRRQGQDGDAQRVRNYFLDQRGQDPNIAYRVRYFDVAGHLATLAPGAHPTADDSTALVQVAGSSTDFAPVACATLRYFFPFCDCQKPATSHNTIARPAGIKSAAVVPHKPVAVRAYPNPAREQVTLETADLPAPIVRVQFVAAATGQVVYTQAANGRERLVVPVAGLAPGLYQARLLDANGQVLGTAKVAVLH